MKVEDYEIRKLDDLNWIIDRVYISEKSGEAAAKRVGYYATLEQAASRLLELLVTDEGIESVRDMVMEISRARNMILDQLREGVK